MRMIRKIIKLFIEAVKRGPLAYIIRGLMPIMDVNEDATPEPSYEARELLNELYAPRKKVKKGNATSGGQSVGLTKEVTNEDKSINNINIETKRNSEIHNKEIDER